MGNSQNFLKPKSKEDIFKAFLDLNVAQKVEMLNLQRRDIADYYDEEGNFKPSLPDIPYEYYPIIYKIHDELSGIKFNTRFSCSPVHILYNTAMKIQIAIGAKLILTNFIKPDYFYPLAIEQYNDDMIMVGLFGIANKPVRFRTFEEFMTWIYQYKWYKKS